MNDLHALVVDDEAFMRNVVCRVLTDLGCRSISEAADGREGWKAIRSTAWPFGLIVLDIAMPKMNGLQFLRSLREQTEGRYKHVPVVMLTGHSELESLRECAKLGIHGFLAKPVSLANLEKQVKHALICEPIDPAVIPSAWT